MAASRGLFGGYRQAGRIELQILKAGGGAWMSARASKSKSYSSEVWRQWHLVPREVDLSSLAAGEHIVGEGFRLAGSAALRAGKLGADVLVLVNGNKLDNAIAILICVYLELRQFQRPSLRGIVADILLRSSSDLCNWFTSSRLEAPPWRISCCAGIFQFLVAWMPNSNADNV